MGKLLDMQLYAVALGRFRAFPSSLTMTVAALWVLVELAAFIGLGVSAVRPMRTAFMIGAAAATLDVLAYAALTIGTKLRGLDVMNCTCFGAYLPQRLSTSVLVQDVVMVVWSLWTLRAVWTVQWAQAGAR